jgi:F-type H+-transporting ATPase subunit delta
VIERTLVNRYAAALLRVTDPEGSTDEAEALLQALQEAYEKDKPFRAVLAQPQLRRAEKKALFRRALEGRAHPSFLRFLDLLVDKNRLNLFPELAEAFRRLADVSRGLVRVQVRSWRPISEAHRQRLEGHLARLTGKKAMIQAETDPRLRGGMLVRMGDTVIDGSVARRLKSIREHLEELGD